MPGRFFASIVLLFGLCLGEVRADPQTEYFVPVRARAVELRGALVPPLSASDARRAALLDKMIEAIDAVSESFAEDVETAKVVAATVVRSFIADEQLPGVVAQMIAGLSGELRAQIDVLSARLAERLGAKLESRGPSLLAKARAALDAAAASPDLKKAVASLLKALKSSAALEKLLSAAGGPSGPCASIPANGARLSVTSEGDELSLFKVTSPIAPFAQSPAGKTYVSVPESALPSVVVAIPLDRADIRTGPLALESIAYWTPPGFGLPPLIWTAAGATVEVVEAGPTRVALCIDATLAPPGAEHSPVQVKGYLVFTR